MTEKAQSRLLGKSSNFISAIKHSNIDLYTHCTSNGKMFIEGYRETVAEYERLVSDVATPLYYHFKTTNGLLIRDLFTQDMVDKYGYGDRQSMTNSVIKRLFYIPNNRTMLLQTINIMKVLLNTYPNLLQRINSETD